MRLFVLFGLVALMSVGCAKKKAKEPVANADTSAMNAPDPQQKVDPKHTENQGTGVGFNRGGNTNYVAGGGATQNIRQAGRRTVVMNDMNQLGVAITNVEIVEGMPDANRIKAEVKTFGPIATSIEDGGIVLTGTKNRAGLWAYEIDADKKGGIVLVAGRAYRADADEVKKLLAQK